MGNISPLGCIAMSLQLQSFTYIAMKETCFSFTTEYPSTVPVNGCHGSMNNCTQTFLMNSYVGNASKKFESFHPS